jgi:hypothetical protein
MSISFTSKDFDKLIEDAEDIIIPSLSKEDLEALTMAIARVKGEDLKESDIINALDQYKRDSTRFIMWRAVFNGLINLDVSEDGTSISFVPDKIKE